MGDKQGKKEIIKRVRKGAVKIIDWISILPCFLLHDWGRINVNAICCDRCGKIKLIRDPAAPYYPKSHED